MGPPRSAPSCWGACCWVLWRPPECPRTRRCLVTFYSQVIFPRLCDFLLDRPSIAQHRRELLASACGKFLFLEHGLSPRPNVQKWQRRLNWWEMKLAGGCRLDRPITRLVSAEPFTSVQVIELDLPGVPPTHAHLYRGIAVK